MEHSNQNSTRAKPARLRQFAIPLLAMLLALQALPVLANDGTTVIREYDDPTASLVYDPVTDGEHVIWQERTNGASCYSMRAVQLADPGSSPISIPSDFSSLIAADDGYLVAENIFGDCLAHDDDASGATGLFLVEIATGDIRPLSLFPFAAEVAIDYPYVAWMSMEILQGEPYFVLKAMNVVSGDEVQILGDSYAGSSRVSLSIDGDTVYWAQGYGSETTGEVGRAKFGEAPGVIKKLHDTTEVAISGDIMVTETDGRLMLHSLASGQELLLANEPAHNLTTDGRYVFWSSGEEQGTSIAGFDTLTNSCFSVWDIRPDDLDGAGSIGSVHAHDGAIVWAHTSSDGSMEAIHGATISDLLPSAAQPAQDSADPDRSYFQTTGHYLTGDFRTFWENNGELPVFGYPLTEEYKHLVPGTGATYSVQMTERQRFEWRPENIGTPYAVLLGRLGETILQQQGRDWTTFEKANPSAEHYFDATGHAIAPEFWDYWSSHGLDFGQSGVSFDESLALFGYPISEPMMETNADGDTVPTQYFERAVFEYHTDNPVSSQVLLRRLGAELLESWGW